jgi:hypothetical protein
MFGYGVKDNKLSEAVVAIAYRYAKQRLCKMRDLDLSDALDYGVARSRYHNRIAEALDCDRELVEAAFTKAAGKVNHPEMAETDEDFTKVFDAFCENLLEVALREDPKDRHPNRLHLEEISNIRLTGIPNLTMPNMMDQQTHNI